MKFISDTTWQKIFAVWRNNEASNPNWIKLATEVKGWPDWESWRSFTAKQLDANHRDWKIFQFENPLVEVPNMLIGPYSSWQSRVVNKNNTTFQELLDIPEQYEEWSSNPGILEIINGLPFPTELVGVLRKDNNKIVCIEGHHRATAISLAQRHKQAIDFSKTPITIALTELSPEHCQLLDKLAQRGTSKNA